MTPKRAALLERFRVRSRERIVALRGAVARDMSADDAEWVALMGDLHTLKGESRMLGLISAASLAHAIEERLHAVREGDRATLRESVDGAFACLFTMLGNDLVEDARAETLAAEGTSLLAGDPRAGGTDSAIVGRPVVEGEGEAAQATASPPAHDANEAVVATQPRARLVDVPAEAIDELCRELEAVRGIVARASTRGSIDHDGLDELLARVDRVGQDAWALCLAPVSPLLASLAAHAEELAVAQGKRVRVVVDAEGTALERAVLDALAEPLLHLVRNAIDHGIELPAMRGDKDPVARLRFSAEPRADAVTLVVADDGAGIDPDAVRDAAVARGYIDRARAAALRDDEKLDLIFRERFSTRDTVSEVSGRGIGLDVVRRVAESMGGSASVESVLGRGTRFLVTVPVALTRERILLVRVRASCFGIAARYVELVVPTAGNVVAGPSGDTLATDLGLLPLRSFARLVGIEDDAEETHALVVRVHDRRWALSVSGLGGERDILRRPADRALRALGMVSASAVLDDGRPVLLPTIADLLRRNGESGTSVRRAVDAKPATRQRHALVVDDSPIVRELVAELLISCGFKVNQAEDGEDALARLDACSFDVIVSDVEMPRCDGLELVRRIRARGVSTPIVMVTTRGSADDRRRAAELGANGYVVKTDFHEGELVSVVRRLAEASP